MIQIFKILLIFLFLNNSICFYKPWNLIVKKLSIQCKNDISEDEYKNEYYNYLLKNNIISQQPLLQSGNLEYIDNIIENRTKNYNIFKTNYLKIKHFNSQNNSFKLELNHFADNYNDDNNNLMKKKITLYDIIKNDFIGIKQIIADPQYYLDKYRSIPNEIIWNNSIISNVKNQGRCGSCWAFSTTGALEANMRINNFVIDRLSEQELVDCSTENSGCNGGLMHTALDYCIENNGLSSNHDYNYTERTGTCLYNCNLNETIQFKRVIGSNISDYKFTVPRSVIDIKASLKKGPICIALDASPIEFRFYKEGIIDIPNRNTSQMNHAVLLTGYSINENGSYWIIQNSWGEKWGDNGYAKIKIQNGDGVLLCQLYGVYIY